MGYQLELNSLLVLPDGSFNPDELKVGEQCSLSKEGERLYPLNIPVEFCDSSYKYIGKCKIIKLTLEKGKTRLEFEVLKLFTPDEAEVFTKNFIKPE